MTIRTSILICLVIVFLSGCLAQPYPTQDVSLSPTGMKKEETNTPQNKTNTPHKIEETEAISQPSENVTHSPANSLTSTAESTQPLATPTPVIKHNTQKIIDHSSVALFDQIPQNYLIAARDMQVMFSDRSVGQNISEFLDCLSASSWAASPAYCRNDYVDASWNWRGFTQTDYDNGLVPERILYSPDPLLYDRGNWTFVYRQGGWSDLTQDFIQSLAPAYLNSKEVLTYQFSYLNVIGNDDIANPNSGFFADNPDKYDIYDLEAFIAQHPDKTFFFWTTSLARGIGTQVATDFNNQMRQYALDHNQFLFDVADIESYTDQGSPCYDNRDSIQYCNQVTGNCENYPNDGLNLPAICQDYTTEMDGGHLGSVSAGGVRLAKAFWVLMARIAGWNGTAPVQ